MILWVDAQLSPPLAPWIQAQFGIEAYSVKWLGYRDAEDHEIFQAARRKNAVMMTKDKDFLNLLEQHGPPPQIVWISLGNTSNVHMRSVLSCVLPQAIKLLEAGEALVEIGESLTQ